MKDNIIKEKDIYGAIRICGCYYKLFEKEEGGGIQEGLDRYPYLKHIVQLRPEDWVKQMSRMNEAVDMKNRIDMSGEKNRLVCPLRRQ